MSVCGMLYRWLPEYMDIPYERVHNAFIAAFDPEAKESFKEKWPMPNIVKRMYLADYVWLPFRFDGEMAYLDWKDEWRIEDYQ